MTKKTEARQLAEYTPAGWGLFIGGFLSLTNTTEYGALRAKQAVASMVKTTTPIEVRQLFTMEEK